MVLRVVRFGSQDTVFGSVRGRGGQGIEDRDGEG